MIHYERLINQKRTAAVKAFRQEQQRVERLSVVAASVPYYEAIHSITSNIHKTTSCRKNNIYDPYASTKLLDFQRQDGMSSFTNERVFSDTKFRLGHALHEAGVANSLYAREIVRRLIPRLPERSTGIAPY